MREKNWKSLGRAREESERPLLYIPDEQGNMTFKRFFGLIAVVVYSAAFFMAGMMVVNLYAIYVLIYTGAVFMMGVYLGERMERRLTAQEAAEVGSGLGGVQEEASEKVELAAKGR